SLQRLDNMRQEFIANVSHEIQSPLTSIRGFAKALLESESIPEKEKHYLDIIEKESSRLSSLSKQLLTLASLDKENHAIKASPFRLDEQIRQVFLATEFQWSEKRLKIDLSLDEANIVADPELLYQVWMNLVTNS